MIRTTRPIWPLCSVIWAFAASVLVLVDVHTPIRAALAGVFVLVCPGLALVRLIDLHDRLDELVLAVAVSVGTTTAVALLMVYGGVWSPTAGFMTLVAISVVANGVELKRHEMRRHQVDGMRPA